MRYKVILGGDGSELFIHEINNSQKKVISEMKLSEHPEESDFDRIEEVLGEKWDCSEEVFFGVYSKSHYISVFDEDENFIWESDEEYFVDKPIDEHYFIDFKRENVLIIESHLKGDFKEYILDIEEPFDPNKFDFKVMEFNNEIQIVTDLKYENQEMKKIPISDDNWTKGIYFHIF